MMQLQDNLFNQQRAGHQPKFKLWKSAGLMLTYWCPSRCACCYVGSSPEAASTDTEMSVDLALAAWQGLCDLAGRDASVHLTGGEPFGDFHRLETILLLAQKARLPGLEKVETNAYWATDDASTRQRLQTLRRLGLAKLQISTDVYHQQFVSIAHVRRAVKIAQEVLGPHAVQVRWRHFYENPIDVAPLAPHQRQQAFQQALTLRPERLLGRAADLLAPLLPLKPPHAFQNQPCARHFLDARHIHIDGCGNIFSGTCVGIILQKTSATPQQSLPQIWKTFDVRNHPVLAPLAQAGPAALLDTALPLGYHPLPGYASKCHLCYHLRRFLFHQKLWPNHLGPAPCYPTCQNEAPNTQKNT